MFTKAIFKAATIAAVLTVPSIAMAQDAGQWQGFYGGLQFSAVSPELNGAPVNLDSGQGAEIFAGYDFAVGGNWVVGGELSYGTSVDVQATPAITVGLEDRIAVRGRAGVAVGNALFYGSVGYMTTDLSVNGMSTGLTGEGATFGLGIEAMLSENISGRIEFNRADLDVGGSPIGIDQNSVSMGVAYRF